MRKTIFTEGFPAKQTERYMWLVEDVENFFVWSLIYISSELQKILQTTNPPDTSVCFAGKPSVKIVFHIFQCLVAQKKPVQWKTIFGQQKTLIKIRLIFYRLFSKKFF